MNIQTCEKTKNLEQISKISKKVPVLYHSKKT